jgi:hypothetical protein
METKGPYKPGQPVDRGPGYEQRDVNVKGLLQFAFWMAIVLIVTLFAMKWTLDYFSKIEPLGAPASPLVSATQRELPANPRLQVYPHSDLENYCSAQEQQVNSYAWIDQQSGIVRIPIDRAMDLALEKGLPARATSEAPPSMPSVAIPVPPSGTDLEGQCGYLTEPPRQQAAAEDGEAH